MENFPNVDSHHIFKYQMYISTLNIDDALDILKYKTYFGIFPMLTETLP